MTHVNKDLFLDLSKTYFDYADFYKIISRRFANPAHFVEVGVWKGDSWKFMADCLRESGSATQWDAVDCWEDQQALEIFQQVRQQRPDVPGLVHQMYSVEAAKKYNDNSLDFVFIDGDHSYQGCSQDISAWWPKVKPGGILAGHDYMRNHPGVIQAVDESFGAQAVHFPGSVWAVAKKPLAPAVVCISLARKRQDRIQCLDSIKRFFPEVKVMDAFDGTQQDLFTGCEGAIGAAISHLKVLRYCVDSHYDNVLVLEDDVLLDARSADRIKRWLDVFEFTNFVASAHHHHNKKTNRRACLGTAAYQISNRRAQHFLDQRLQFTSEDPRSIHFDWQLGLFVDWYDPQSVNYRTFPIVRPKSRTAAKADHAFKSQTLLSKQAKSTPLDPAVHQYVETQSRGPISFIHET